MAKYKQRDYKQCINDDVDFALQIRMLPALAFVPLDNVVKDFETLQRYMAQEALPVLD